MVRKRSGGKTEAVKTKARAKVKRAGEAKPSARARRTVLPTPRAELITAIVGVGASAGGPEAFMQLLRHLPTDTGMAFVLVQHLEARHESMLTKLLAGVTSMPVAEVRHGMRVQPNHVYVIPANADITIVDGTLVVAGRRAPAGHHMPIDHFFRSLAEDQGARAIGVILSGTASDGTLGLKAIKAEGGITFAQEPGSAKYDGMPRSAIATGCVDFVLPVEAIAKELARIGRHPYIGLRVKKEVATVLEGRQEDLDQIFKLLRAASGVDFTYYKKSTIKRRIARRMALHKLDSLSGYLKYLEENPGELDALYQDILIHVTSFFREPEVFRALQSTILPRILAEKPTGEPIRIWVPGCSTGEEVYSIGVCLLECLGDRASAAQIRIFGTDISEQAIEHARLGIYPESALGNVSEERLHRFFSRTDEQHYRVSTALRELCVFARHDLTKDPSFPRLDLISCRNVLIYLEPVLQKRVLASFHYALTENGFLLLGKSETLGTFTELFTLVDKYHKFFAKKTGATRSVYEVEPGAYEKLTPLEKRGPMRAAAYELEGKVDSLLWNRYSHAGIVVNQELEILLFRGDTSPYVRPAPGRPALSLMKMLREDLVFPVRALIQKARRTGNAARKEAVRLEHNRTFREVNLEVLPLGGGNARERQFLVLFEGIGPLRVASENERLAARSRRPQSQKEDREIHRLKEELARTKEYLQAIIQEQETTNEELKAANEEALSSMEELQSTNEELETAKEELQSSNEELVTLYEQAQHRNAELAQLSDDLTNFLSGVDIPILMLGGDYCIRRFTPAAEKLLRLLPSDVGRPLGDLRVRVEVPDLEDLISKVIGEGSEVNREVRAEDGRWYSLRMRPYRTRDHKIDGILISFVDIDEMKQIQEALRANEKKLRELTSNLVAAQEEERRRVSRELHDDLIQRMGLLAGDLGAIEEELRATDETSQRLHALTARLNALIDSVKRTAYQLHPSVLEHLGLAPALESYCTDFSKQHKIKVTFRQRHVPANIRPPVALSLYRIVQECLGNVAKHSGASQASVTLEGSKEGIRLIIADRGRGFDPALVKGMKGLGFVSIEERVSEMNGSLSVNAEAEKGTRVMVYVPLAGDGA